MSVTLEHFPLFFGPDTEIKVFRVCLDQEDLQEFKLVYLTTFQMDIIHF